jgi:hypothetical protein
MALRAFACVWQTPCSSSRSFRFSYSNGGSVMTGTSERAPRYDDVYDEAMAHEAELDGPPKHASPLDTAGVLWVAALDRVPIEERVQWVKTMQKRVAEINAKRAAS